MERGNPCRNGFIESCTGKLRAQLLNAELFDILLEARVLTERCRRHYNAVRPHSALCLSAPSAGSRVLSNKFSAGSEFDSGTVRGNGSQ
ncbi:MAG: transposase [Fuerstiella sp.]|nr:transposase [Fuerstiella sp.]MCP4509171.1 transposase [Fuerstiella sp.]